MTDPALADRIGQIAFRLELNADYIKRFLEKSSQTAACKMRIAALTDIQADLEKLKKIKAELLQL